MVSLRIMRVGSVEAPSPRYATPGAAGLDLCAALTEPLELPVGQRRSIPTGFAIEVPAGYEAQVRPRSGLALHHGVTVVNAPGTIDSDYRGEVKVLLVNHGEAPYWVVPGTRIAQLVVAPVTRVTVEVVDRLATTERDQGGFGSTGT